MRTKHQSTKGRGQQSRRRGNIILLSAIMMVMTAAFVAFAVDLGSLYMARCELQRAADAAALSAAWDLVNQEALSGSTNYTAIKTDACNSAIQFASLNKVLNSTVNVPVTDIEIGYLADPTNSSATMDTASINSPNTVRVTVKRTTSQNGAVPFAFARVLGFNDQNAQAQATAGMCTNFNGFRTPSDGSNLGILPLALDEQSWNSLLAGGGTDEWKWDEATQSVVPGSDGIKEVNLYPQGTLTPGNRGTIDIGSANNSTADLGRQIREGISPADMAYHGGELKFNSEGKLYLSGDPGISAGIKDDLVSIIGKARTIPLFTEVNGPGNNAVYTIDKFVGVRVLDVKLTGSQSSKRVIIQPATIVAKGAIPATDGNDHSDFVYSPVWLIH